MQAAVKEVKEFSAARKESLLPVHPGTSQAAVMGKVIPFPLNKVNSTKATKMPGLKDDYRGLAQETITAAVKPPVENGAFASSSTPIVGKTSQMGQKGQTEWTTRPNPVLASEDSLDSAFSFLFTKAEAAVENSARRTVSGVKSRHLPEQKNILPLATRQYEAVNPHYQGSLKANSATFSQFDSGQNENGQDQLGRNKREKKWKNLLLGCLTALVLFGIGGFLGETLGNSEADNLPSSPETIQQVELAQAGMAIW